MAAHRKAANFAMKSAALLVEGDEPKTNILHCPLFRAAIMRPLAGAAFWWAGTVERSRPESAIILVAMQRAEEA
jgi:hypothetical protein